MKYKISDIAEINKKNINKNYKGKVFYLDTSSVTNDFFNCPKIYTSLKEAPIRARRLAEDGDTIISTVRPAMRHVGYISQNLNRVYSTGFAIISPKKSKVNPFYLYLVLSSKEITNLLQSIAVGSTSAYPSIKPRDIGNLIFDFPSLCIQEKIASIMQQIILKIKMNNQINDNLLELISSIWKKQSSDIHNKITLKRLAKRIITGKTPSTKIKENYGIDIPFVKIPDMHNKIFIDETSQKLSIFGANSQKNKYVPKNSIIVSCIGTPGLVSLIGRTVQTNQQINSLILDNKYIYCTYLELKSLKYKIRNLGSGGTTIQNLNKTNFGNIKITVPNKDSQLDNFNGIAKPIFERIHVNNIELQNLVKIKEVLLGQYF